MVVPWLVISNKFPEWRKCGWIAWMFFFLLLSSLFYSKLPTLFVFRIQTTPACLSVCLSVRLPLLIFLAVYFFFLSSFFYFYFILPKVEMEYCADSSSIWENMSRRSRRGAFCSLPLFLCWRRNPNPNWKLNFFFFKDFPKRKKKTSNILFFFIYFNWYFCVCVCVHMRTGCSQM